MSCWMCLLLLVVLGWVAFLHLLNGNSQAGDLARLLVLGLIEKVVGRREAARVDQTGQDDNPVH